jgi:hypothetical protein
MNSDFEPPPKGWSILAHAGGVVTAIVAIAGLNALSSYLHKTASSQPGTSTAQTAKTDATRGTTTVAKLDNQSIELPGKQVTSEEISATQTPYVAPSVGTLTPKEMEMARGAWQYFQSNWNEETGLVNSVDKFASVTMWDQAAAIAALVSAKELGIVSEAEFNTKMSQMLKTLAKMPLYKGELPNKVYNSKTLLPVNYGQLDKKEEIGWSALDLGRLALLAPAIQNSNHKQKPSGNIGKWSV